MKSFNFLKLNLHLLTLLQEVDTEIKLGILIKNNEPMTYTPCE